jgi:hypothetical protein
MNMVYRAGDIMKLRGKAKLIVRDIRTGLILEVREIDNLITTAGKNFIASVVNGEATLSNIYIAVGSGTTTPAVGDTTLEGEIGRLPITSKTRTNNQILYSTYFGSGDCNGTWNKIGIFNAQSGGTLISELLISPSLAKDTTKAVDVEYTITFG